MRKGEGERWWRVKETDRKEEEKSGQRECGGLSLLDITAVTCQALQGRPRACWELLWPCMLLPLAHKEDLSLTFSALNRAAGTSAISKRAWPVMTLFLNR